MRKNNVIIPIFIIVILTFWLFAQYYQEDAWEKRHNDLQPPEKILNAIGAKPGMVIGEIGAGRGRYAVHLAKRVGDTGKIYANDIDQDALNYLKKRCKRDNIKNITTLLGKETDPLFPESSLDMAFIINTYHHIDQPVALMNNLVPSLKENATLVIVEHNPDKMEDLSGHHSTKKGVVIEQMNRAGFELVEIHSFLVNDEIFIFKPKPVN